MQTLLIAVLAAALGLELAGRLGIRWLHRRTGVFYAPRDVPRLSPACRDFLTRLVRAGGQGGVLWFDSLLGWAPAPHRRDARGLQETNSKGIRSRHEPAALPGAGAVRVAAFGDCLTYGEGCAVEDSWVARLEHWVPGTEALNFGVDGYGLDQCYLRYQWSRSVYGGARVVVIALVSSNIYKSLNAFRPFYSYDHDLKLAKPRFELRDGRLETVPNPVPAVAGYEALLRDPATELPRLGALDAYHRRGYRRHALDRIAIVRLARVITHEIRKLRQVRDRHGRLVPGSEAMQTTLATLDAFCARVRADGADPVVVLLPTPEDARRGRRRDAGPWGPVAEHLRAARVPHLDVLAALWDDERTPARRWFDGRHLTPAMNDRLAERLAAVLRPLTGVAPPVTHSTSGRDPVQRGASRVRAGTPRVARAGSGPAGPPTA